MAYFCIIQSRTNSTRLPGKCFLPVAGMPLIELCAKRSKTKFAETWVATSSSPSDDLLANMLEKSKISYYRSSLDNVLERFQSLCRKQKVKSDDTVIRLTGDNPLVDSLFLEQMRLVWENNDLDYLSGEPPNLKEFSWPKGLSAEFFKAGSLYDVPNKSTNSYSLEHVTPDIQKSVRKISHMGNFLKINYQNDKSFGIDSLDDYLYVAKIFNQVRWDDSYENLLKLLAK